MIAKKKMAGSVMNIALPKDAEEKPEPGKRVRNDLEM